MMISNPLEYRCFKYKLQSVNSVAQFTVHLIFREKGRTAQFKISSLEERDDTDDAAYWKGYPAVLPDKVEHCWDAVVDAMDKYR